MRMGLIETENVIVSPYMMTELEEREKEFIQTVPDGLGASVILEIHLPDKLNEAERYL